MNIVAFNIVKYVLLGLAVVAILVAHNYFKFNDNNLVEDIVEKEVKNETGFSINLETPTSSSSDSKDSNSKEGK